MNYAQILPELFLGSYPRSADDIDRLRQEAVITAVLNLQTDDDMRSLNLSWETLQAHYEACHVDLRRVPVRDFDSTELCSKLPESVRTLDQLLAAGHSVYLHCTAGTGRSPTVAIAYLHRCRDWKLDEAWAHGSDRRQCSPNLEAILAADWDPTTARRLTVWEVTHQLIRVRSKRRRSGRGGPAAQGGSTGRDGARPRLPLVWSL